MIVATYSPEGTKGVLREGGELESIYYAFGSYDVRSAVDIPDNVTAAAIAAHEDVLPPAW